jgi:hypothetical protein
MAMCNVVEEKFTVARDEFVIANPKPVQDKNADRMQE